MIVAARLMTVCKRSSTWQQRSSKLHKIYQCWFTGKNFWWWAERLPETCGVVIPIKLEFSGPVGFNHKEYDTMHGHTILKKLWAENYRILTLTSKGNISRCARVVKTILSRIRKTVMRIPYYAETKMEACGT